MRRIIFSIVGSLVGAFLGFTVGWLFSFLIFGSGSELYFRLVRLGLEPYLLVAAAFALVGFLFSGISIWLITAPSGTTKRD